MSCYSYVQYMQIMQLTYPHKGQHTEPGIKVENSKFTSKDGQS